MALPCGHCANLCTLLGSRAHLHGSQRITALLARQCRIPLYVARALCASARSSAERLPRPLCRGTSATATGMPVLRSPAAALQYKRMYTESIEQPEAFWGKMAEEFHWELKVRLPSCPFATCGVAQPGTANTSTRTLESRISVKPTTAAACLTLVVPCTHRGDGSASVKQTTS